MVAGTAAGRLLTARAGGGAQPPNHFGVAGATGRLPQAYRGQGLALGTACRVAYADPIVIDPIVAGLQRFPTNGKGGSSPSEWWSAAPRSKKISIGSKIVAPPNGFDRTMPHTQWPLHSR